MISESPEVMASRPSKIVVTPITKAIDHYFELALYLLVLTGFGTLAATGGLDLPSMILGWIGACLTRIPDRQTSEALHFGKMDNSTLACLLPVFCR